MRSRQDVIDALYWYNYRLTRPYRKRFETGYRKEGEINVRVVIDTWGNVLFCELVKSSINNPGLEDETLKEVLKMKCRQIFVPNDTLVTEFPILLAERVLKNHKYTRNFLDPRFEIPLKDDPQSLLRALLNPEENVAIAAAWRLGNRRDTALLPELVNLGRTNRASRVFILMAIGLYQEDGVESFRKILQHESRDYAKDAVRVVECMLGFGNVLRGQVLPVNHEYRNICLDFLESPKADAVEFLSRVELLGRIGNERAARIVLRMYRESDMHPPKSGSGRAEDFQSGFSHMDKSCVPLFFSELRSDDVSTRRACAHALGHINSKLQPDSLGVLVKAFHGEPDSMVKFYLLLVIGNFNSERSSEALFSIFLDRGNSVFLRERAFIENDHYWECTTREKHRVIALLADTTEPTGMRACAAELLGHLREKDKEVDDLLRTYRNNPREHWRVRSAASTAAEIIKDKGWDDD
jgi:hypothetical protein